MFKYFSFVLFYCLTSPNNQNNSENMKLHIVQVQDIQHVDQAVQYDSVDQAVQ